MYAALVKSSDRSVHRLLHGARSGDVRRAAAAANLFATPSIRRRQIRAACCVFLLCVVCCPRSDASRAVAGEADVYFSPHGGATQAVVREISAAKKTIRVLGYGFTSPEIVQALVDAHVKRKIDVQVVLDRSNLTQKSSLVGQ